MRINELSIYMVSLIFMKQKIIYKYCEGIRDIVYGLYIYKKINIFKNSVFQVDKMNKYEKNKIKKIMVRKR